MNLKEAREKNKLEQFIREREQQPPAKKKRFHKLIKTAASQIETKAGNIVEGFSR